MVRPQKTPSHCEAHRPRSLGTPSPFIGDTVPINPCSSAGRGKPPSAGSSPRGADEVEVRLILNRAAWVGDFEVARYLLEAFFVLKFRQVKSAGQYFLNPRF